MSRSMFKLMGGFVWMLCAGVLHAERINQEGRILGVLPAVTNSLLFNTTNADAVLSAMQVFPITNPWNEDISRRPVLTNSDSMIAQIISDLRSDRRSLIAFQEMNFALIPDNQGTQPIEFFNYWDESDADGGVDPFGLYPIPTNLPVEGWPTQTSTQTLSQVQQDYLGLGGDRHTIMVKPGAGFIWETWDTRFDGTNWHASNGAKFNLNTNSLRPAGWTSGDAAGLPMFPALVRFDECERGMVEHAMRIVVKRSRYGTYIYPATHYAAPSSNISPDLPAMGQRVRLKSSFVISANWTKQEKAVLLAMKKYGAMVADNGNFFSISVTPDNLWPSGCFDHFTSISITNFEVIQTTGPMEGPRSAGAPIAFAGADQSVPLNQTVQLQGVVTSGGALLTNRWKLYSGPGTVTFTSPNQTNTTASFSAPGVYTLMLIADDQVHAVAYDAVVITVSSQVSLLASISGTNLVLNWSGGTAPFVVERTWQLANPNWAPIATTMVQSVSFPMTNSSALFRVRSAQ